MLDASKFSGTHQYGTAYRIMLENDLHAPGSVDRVLWARAIRLCPETAPYLYSGYTSCVSRYREGLRPALEGCIATILADDRAPEEAIVGIASFASDLALGVAGRDSAEFGGTEEEIIDRGSDWCTDIARVACILCQVAGVAARLASVYDLDHAYSSRTIIEAHRSGAWGAVDPLAAVVYRHPGGRPASVRDLLADPRILEGSPDPGPLRIRPGSNMTAGIVNYSARRRRHYSYAVSRVNDYYRPILEMSERGWPEGLRWLHGEDRAP